MGDNNVKINGNKNVKSIWWHKESGDECITANENKTLVYSYEFHGDYANEWILVIENGRETARHNMRYISSIIWCPLPDEADHEG